MKLYITAAFTLLIVLAAHLFGLDGLYYKIDSYDIFMHILGGAGIGLFVAALLRSYSGSRYFSRRNIVIGVIVAGIVWEIFEMCYGLTGYPVGTKLYYIDTIKDMIDDIIGGTLVAWIIARTPSSTSSL